MPIPDNSDLTLIGNSEGGNTLSLQVTSPDNLGITHNMEPQISFWHHLAFSTRSRVEGYVDTIHLRGRAEPDHIRHRTPDDTRPQDELQGRQLVAYDARCRNWTVDFDVLPQFLRRGLIAHYGDIPQMLLLYWDRPICSICRTIILTAAVERAGC